MTKCTNCQSNLAESAKFCPYCGTPVVRVEGQPALSVPQEAIPTSANKINSNKSSSSRAGLILWTFLFATAGAVLILVVAPEFEGRYGSPLFGYVYFQTVESWAALIGGGVCLLLSGTFLLKAISAR